MRNGLTRNSEARDSPFNNIELSQALDQRLTAEPFVALTWT
jgi:hypothetical protein